MITIGLLTNEIISPNYGVSALGICNILLIERAIGDKEHKYIVFDKENKKNASKEVLNSIPELKNVNIEFRPILCFREGIKGIINFSHHIKECNVIFDTSGGDSFSDIYGHNRIFHQTFPKFIVLKNKKSLVFPPQTIGPFKNVIWRTISKNIMKRSALVFARDHLSYEYAKKLGIRSNLAEVTDMAMALPYATLDAKTASKKVGLNISGLLYNGGYNIVII